MRAFIKLPVLTLACFCVVGGAAAESLHSNLTRRPLDLRADAAAPVGPRFALPSGTSATVAGFTTPQLASQLEPGLGTQAVAMSDHGLVAGYIWPSTISSANGLFLWDRGVLTDLDPLREWDWQNRVGADVNDHGQVVATAAKPGGFLSFRPLLFERGVIIDLMGLRPGGGGALAINNRGQVAGVYADGITAGGFLWDRGQWTDLGPADASYATDMAMNDRGDVVGRNGSGSFLWQNGVRTELDFVVTGINDHGLVIGNDASRAVVWKEGTRTDLGTLGGASSFAVAINNKAQVAGWSQTAAGEYHAFRWEDGHMSDLGGGSGGGPLVIQGIGPRGEVVGYEVESRYWLWTSEGEAPTLIAGDIASGLFGPWMFIDHFGHVAFNNIGEPSFVIKIWSDGKVIDVIPTTTAVASARRSAGAGAGVSAAEDYGREPNAMESPAAVTSLAMASANPFSANAMLHYAVPRSGHVTIEVFDVRGARVRLLVDEWQPVGSRSVTWDGADVTGRRVPPGLYLTRLRVGAESRSVKLIRGR